MQRENWVIIDFLIFPRSYSVCGLPQNVTGRLIMHAEASVCKSIHHCSVFAVAIEYIYRKTSYIKPNPCFLHSLDDFK